MRTLKFNELYLGQPLVHMKHGVGRYLGLISLTVRGIVSEYLMLLYANNAKLYVPISSLHLIYPYEGGLDSQAPLHKLGSDSWSRICKKTLKKINDVVVELLDIYAKRNITSGFAFKFNVKKYEIFCEAFPFETTQDQQKAINEVLTDMCQPITMDRLICGDVGFGKTEVAMRAAFLAVQNNKQVAMLVPTTLLAQQHYEHFRDRFSSWPVRIDMLSRFRSTKEQKKIIKRVSEGEIDILISTHKLFMCNFNWYNLGLLIVDEEHRFGVRHKEKIKAMRTNIDILTLTATPIPRTLNLAISGIRDLSLITTPPARRLAVKTFVTEYNESIIRDAILNEVMRGGQIYYLYNNVEKIEMAAKKISVLVPEVNVGIGHGQMRERELEKVMNDFHEHRFHVLVCTTIIETGIDVHNANTIIIERADQLGLAQLHQLRGRVGRSHHQAYAWLLTPDPKSMTTSAKKRLQAISSLEDLGAGFALAMHDLEIRGAGELLGEEQSGEIETIGVNLYMEFLEKAVESLRSGQELSLHELMRDQPNIEMSVSALLPESFIQNVNTRLSIYKRIAMAKNEHDLINIQLETINHFGKLPTEANHLFNIAKLRLAAYAIGICKIEANEKGGFLQFKEKNKLNVNRLMILLKANPKQWKLESSNQLKFVLNLNDQKFRIEWIYNLIKHLQCNTLK